VTQDSGIPHHVITGLVPVIPMWKSTAPLSIGMAGTRPAMTAEGFIPAGIIGGGEAADTRRA
jgi:hypothetical protein